MMDDADLLRQIFDRRRAKGFRDDDIVPGLNERIVDEIRRDAFLDSERQNFMFRREYGGLTSRT